MKEKNRKWLWIGGLLAVLAWTEGCFFFFYGRIWPSSPSFLTLALRQELREVTKVRVRTGGVCHRHPESERWLFTLRDHEAQAFIKALQIRCEDEGCMCCGSHTFEFYRKNQLVAQCSWHHGETLRWHKETGEENQRLVLASKRYLKKLLKPYEGVPY